MRLLAMVARRLGRILAAIVGAYFLWIALSTLLPSIAVAQIMWFALAFVWLVAVSRFTRRGRGETPTPTVGNEDDGGRALHGRH